MRFLDGRTAFAFILGAGVAVACFSAGTSFAGPSPAPVTRAPATAASTATTASAAAAAPLVTKACANKKTGALTIVGSQHRKCTSKEKAVQFAGLPPKSILASDGTLTLKKGASFTSANGLYRLVVNNKGVGLKGPGGSFYIDEFSPKTITQKLGVQ